jgi:hypothetical protein
MWLDNFFICNITPIFYIEVLADLEKEIQKGRSPEMIVGNLAHKTPDMGSKCNAYHTTLIAGELSRLCIVKMDERPIISRGEYKELDGRMGVFFKPSPEEEAFHRWQHGEFLNLERLQAKKWRNGLMNINLEANYKLFQKFFIVSKPKTLKDVKQLVDSYINGLDQKNILLLGISLLGIPEKAEKLIMNSWDKEGRPKINKFAPYFTYVFSVELFFNLAIASDLIGRGRPSHKMDLAYLYYLPFCKVFTSNDKLHMDMVPLFLNERQTFISGTDLKNDLSKLDKFYDKFSEEIKGRGVMRFAFYPPTTEKFLISDLWDKYMSKEWRNRANNPRTETDDLPPDNKIIEEMHRFKEEAKIVPDGKGIDLVEPKSIMIERRVYGIKGKWRRLPPECFKN